MKVNTVRNRILKSNTIMILSILILFLLINLIVVKLYAESIEHVFEVQLNQPLDSEGIKEIVKEWTIKKNDFILLFLVDGIICVLVLVGVSQLFTYHLTKQIMFPLSLLDEGAKRIQKNDLSQNICYRGDKEFESVCQTFNEMQKHIFMEQEKNCQYERARTNMIAGISHDLRTPLTAIKGSVKSILDGVVHDENLEKKFLNIAYKRTLEMDVLLNQLFYLSKLETGNIPLKIEKGNMNEFLVHYVYQKQELNDSIILDLVEYKKDVYCMFDIEQMHRILDNLIENSIKYSGKEKVNVSIFLKCQNKQACIEVADDGVGVCEEEISYLFDEFYRVDSSRNAKEGSGLGLYIVKSLVEAMSGSVCAYNRNGFVVEMKFPLERNELYVSKENSDY